MSKSVYNSSGCGKTGCASKSLLNIDGVSSTAATSISQFISGSNQNNSGGGGNPTTGNDCICDDLLVNNNLTVLGSAGINTIETNSISIKGGAMTLTDNVISSNTNIILNPNNPSGTCNGEVTVQDNLTVEGCYTHLCTAEFWTLDPVPTIGYCGIDPPLDNDDRGIEFRYADINDITPPLTQRRGFLGYDKDRDRFVFWNDSVVDGGISGLDQNYERIPTNPNPNGVEADILYTYKITNPDYSNSPLVLAGLSKFNVIIEATDEFNTMSVDQLHNVTQNLQYNVGLKEIHHIATGLGNAAIYRVDINPTNVDPNTSCNYIEMTDNPSRSHGGILGKGTFLYNSTKIELNTKYCGSGGVIDILSDGLLTMTSNNNINIISNDNVNVAGDSIVLTAGNGPIQLLNTNGFINKTLCSVLDQIGVYIQSNDPVPLNSIGLDSIKNIFLDADDSVYICSAGTPGIEMMTNGLGNLTVNSNNLIDLNSVNSTTIDASDTTNGNITITSNGVNGVKLLSNSVTTGIIEIESNGSQVLALTSGINDVGIYIHSDLSHDIAVVSSEDIMIDAQDKIFLDTTINANGFGYIQSISRGWIDDTTINSAAVDSVTFASIPVGTRTYELGTRIQSSNNHDVYVNAKSTITGEGTFIVNPGIEFQVQPLLGISFTPINPGRIPETTTYFSEYESAYSLFGILSRTQGLRTRWAEPYTGIVTDLGTIFGNEKLYLLSDVDGTNGTAWDGWFSVFKGNSGHLVTPIQDVRLEADGLHIDMDVFITGDLDADSPNNNVCANGIIIQETLVNTCYTTNNVNIGALEEARVMYLDPTVNQVHYSTGYTGPGVFNLAYDGANMYWTPPGGGPSTTTLQQAYDNDAAGPAQILLDNIRNQVRIRESIGYGATDILFDVVSSGADPYFRIRNSTTVPYDARIVMGNNAGLSVEVEIDYGTFAINSSAAPNASIFRVTDNTAAATDVFRVTENPTVTNAHVHIRSGTSTADVPILRVRDDTTLDLFRVFESPSDAFENTVRILPRSGTNKSGFEIRDNADTNRVFMVTPNATAGVASTVRINQFNAGADGDIFYVNSRGGTGLFEIIESPSGTPTDGGPSIKVRPTDGTTGARSMSFYDSTNVQKVWVTPNNAKVMHIDGDVTITGTIDPNGVVFEGINDISPLNPSDPGIGNGTVYVRRNNNFGSNLPLTSLTYIENDNIVTAPVERPIVIYDDSSTVGGYYAQPIIESVSVFSTTYGNRVKAVPVTISSAGHIENATTISMGVMEITLAVLPISINPITDPEYIICNGLFGILDLPSALTVEGRRYTIINKAVGPVTIISSSTIINASTAGSAIVILQDTTAVYVAVDTSSFGDTWVRIV